MHRVKGVIVQHLAGEIRAFSTMKEPSILTADGYSTFTMKRMSVCFDAAAAPGFLSKNTIDTAKATSCINYEFLVRKSVHLKVLLISIRKLSCPVGYHRLATAGTVERSFSDMASFVQVERQIPQP